MLLRLELKNFRRHRDLVIDFTSGLNVIRGRNEGGKSTILEAMLYALYGTRSLRDSLSETVTWGHKESELSVRLKIQVGKMVYNFKRSKGGAEAFFAEADAGNVGGALVTGQAEVSALAADILGADLKSVSSLMMASQNALRGALDEGPAAVSALMSKLADFDLIDRLLDKANSSLMQGSPQQLQIQLASTQQMLDEAKAQVIPDKAAVKQKLDATHEAWKAQKKAVDEAVAVLLRAEDQHKQVQAIEAEYQEITKAAGDLAIKKQNLLARSEELAKIPSVDQRVIEDLRQAVEEERTFQQRMQTYQRFQAIVYPEVYWDEPEDTFEAAYTAAQNAVTVARNDVARIDGQIFSTQQRLIKDGKCPTCGHDKNDPAHTAKHNAEVNTEISRLQAVRGVLVAAHEGALSDLEGLRMVAKAATEYRVALAPYAGKYTLDTRIHPARATWIGEPPTASTVQGAAAKLQEATAADRAYQQAVGQLEAIGNQLQEIDVAIAGLIQRKVELCGEELPMSPAPFWETVKRETLAVGAARTRLEELGREYDALGAELTRIDMEEQRYTATVEMLTKQVTQLQENIKAVEFNNVLMKKLKAMKPMITDFLWGQVLKAVGLFFSQMRGEQSLVTKDGEGFKVNGRSVESLSGSTLDVLALAIRCALVKTFIPHANFLILDEPAAGCDESRTGSVLGFVSTMGFSQTIMASHDPLSESVADNVISLGA